MREFRTTKPIQRPSGEKFSLRAPLGICDASRRELVEQDRNLNRGRGAVPGADGGRDLGARRTVAMALGRRAGAIQSRGRLGTGGVRAPRGAVIAPEVS